MLFYSFSIIYFGLFCIFYFVGIPKIFVIIYFLFGVVGFVYLDNDEKKKRKK